MNYQEIIDKYYPAGSPLRDIYMRHCRSVANLAIKIADRKALDIDRNEIEAAAMLHDIGIFMTDAPGIECHGSEPYILHGVIGAQLLRENGMPERDARVAERHTGAGIDRDDIIAQNLPLPLDGDFMPATQLERLICYADKFYSKSGDMKRKPMEKVVASMKRISQGSLERFLKLKDEFE
ncbi:MAG: HDIG domain-containing protein [Duncaniella sp.]|nr:HDIG domain-containing protein [Duncaniella sp.]MDE5962007.1 HDIG domain-containing protein [Duncaniella sp.]